MIFLAAAMLSLNTAFAQKVPHIAPGLALPEMQMLSPRVYVAELAPGLWVHTTVGTLGDGSLYAANGALLEEGTRSILFDTGWTPEEAGTLLHWARVTLRHPVYKAYVTHFHNDRLGGAAELEKRHIPVYASTLTIDLARETKMPIPDHPIDLPSSPTAVGRDAIIFYPGPGHTRDNLVVYFPAERVLYGGCFVKWDNAQSLGNLGDADVQAWPKSLKRMEDAFPEFKLVIPGHGPVGRNAVERTAKLLTQSIVVR